MPVTRYSSTDTDAPVFNPTVDYSFNNVLKKCLVEGYGSKGGAGWSVTFENEAIEATAFKQGAGSALPCSFAITSPIRSGRLYTRLRIGQHFDEVISSSNVSGTDIANGQYSLFLSNSLSADPVPWEIIANDYGVFCFIDVNKDGDFFGCMFNNIVSDKVNDDGIFMVACNNQTSWNVNSNFFDRMTTVSSSSLSGHVIRRDVAGADLWPACGKFGDQSKAGGAFFSGRMAYPTPTHGGLSVGPVFCAQTDIIRGVIPGIWSHLHSSRPLANLEEIDGQGPLAGRRFLAVNLGYPTTNTSQALIEISDTWYTG